MKRVLCVVATPYHVLNLYNILSSAEYENCIIDVIVISESIVHQVCVLKYAHCIRNIYIFKALFERTMSKWKTLRNIQLLFKLAQQVLWAKLIMNCRDEVYDIVLSSHPSIPTYVLQNHFLKNNHLCKSFYFEDGVGTYNSFGSYRSDTTRKFFQILFQYDYFKVISRVYVYRPDLFRGQIRKENVYPIIISQNIDHYRDFYALNYKSELEKYQFARCILFDELMLLNNNEQIDKEIEITKMICDILGYEKVILKPHPRAIKTYSSDIVLIANDKLPFEVIMMNIDVEKMILLTTWSTACITPKLIQDKEPIVVSLSGILSEATEMTPIFNMVKQLYRDGKRFCMPSSSLEVLNIVEKYGVQ